MAVNVVLNGVSYSIPDPGDNSWGQDTTDYLVAQASGLLQKAGGSFTLTAEVDFGATFGLKSAYFKSRGTNPSTAGVLRLANAEAISWRNAANGANLSLLVNASNLLEFNGTAIQPSGNYITALTGDVAATGPGSAVATIQSGVIVNSMVSGSAAIAYSKLSLAASITNADLSTVATQTIKGRTTAGTGAPQDLTATQATAILNAMVGDSGSGGTKGLVPAPAAGDAAAGKVLKADGTWTTVGAGTVTSVALTVPTALFATSPVTGSPVTSSGTLAPTLATQTARTFFSGPLSGSAATPTFKALTAPTVQKFTSTGTTTGWLFTISTSSTLAVGDTYTNNGNTYTVQGALTAQTGQVLFCSQASAPQASGTLTKAVSASGPATITFSAAVATATYTAPTNPAPLFIRVRGVAGGGGGEGAGSSPTSGGSGGSTNFGANLLSATGGGGGTGTSGAGSGGTGGTASLGSGPVGTALTGGTGTSGGVNSPGGPGASSPFGGGGGGGAYGGNASSVGVSAAANTGSGGGGGSGVTTNSGAGGGAGGFIDAIIASPNATYPYSIGAAGANGTSSGGQGNGGSGGSGYIEVTEYYQ